MDSNGAAIMENFLWEKIKDKIKISGPYIYENTTFNFSKSFVYLSAICLLYLIYVFGILYTLFFGYSWSRLTLLAQQVTLLNLLTNYNYACFGSLGFSIA